MDLNNIESAHVLSIIYYYADVCDINTHNSKGELPWMI